MSIPPAAGTPSTPDSPEWRRLAEAVHRAFAGTPYRVEASPERISVVADLADARFLGLASVRRFSKVYRTTLTPKGPGRAAWEDAEETVSWTAGVDGTLVPRLTGQISGMRGRKVTVQFRKEVGVDANGLGFPVDYRFSSTEIQRPLKAAVAEAGFRTAMATTTRIGVIFAIIAGLGVLATGVVWALVGLGILTPQ